MPQKEPDGSPNQPVLPDLHALDYNCAHLSFHGIEYEPPCTQVFKLADGPGERGTELDISSHEWRLTPGFGKNGTDHEISRVEARPQRKTCTYLGNPGDLDSLFSFNWRHQILLSPTLSNKVIISNHTEASLGLSLIILFVHTGLV